jgi:hypothetical protein
MSAGFADIAITISLGIQFRFDIIIVTTTADITFR